jgi:glycosyltransferase involved in cell wall biosynthesis
MRVLMVSTVMPHRMSLGGEVVTQNFIDAIAGLGHDIDVVAYTRFGDRSVPPANFHSAGPWHIETNVAGMRPYWWLARAFLSGAPYITTKFRSRQMIRAIRALTAQRHYDCCIIDHTHLGWLLGHDALPGPTIFIAHNVESQLYADQAADGVRHGRLKRAILGRDARLLAGLERRLVGQCRQTWALTPREREVFAGLAEDAPGKVHAYDIPGKALASTARKADADIDVGILGGWLWDVNRSGLEWFMAEVIPLLPSTIRVHIAGKGADLVPNPYSNVVYEGFVDDAIDFMRRCRVIVVPTVAGAGVQVKTIEGICSGVPMITTPIGLRGISRVPDYVAVAATADEMASLIRERVQAPMPADLEAGARWATGRLSAFRESVRQALAQVAGEAAAAGRPSGAAAAGAQVVR